MRCIEKGYYCEYAAEARRTTTHPRRKASSGHEFSPYGRRKPRTIVKKASSSSMSSLGLSPVVGKLQSPLLKMEDVSPSLYGGGDMFSSDVFSTGLRIPSLPDQPMNDVFRSAGASPASSVLSPQIRAPKPYRRSLPASFMVPEPLERNPCFCAPLQPPRGYTSQLAYQTYPTSFTEPRNSVHNVQPLLSSPLYSEVEFPDYYSPQTDNERYAFSHSRCLSLSDSST